jgi:DNA repair exonuclease SbcCD ATPase subunit
MKVIRLSASNIMRLRAVEVEPNGTVQIVAGKNGAGKSSLLNALYLALAGGQASREIAKPVRAGEEWAEVDVTIAGENVTLLITRTWDEKGTHLTVKYSDGAKVSTPQTLLDSLLGALTFDPLEFTRQRPADQRQTLLDLLGLDFWSLLWRDGQSAAPAGRP